MRDIEFAKWKTEDKLDVADKVTAFAQIITHSKESNAYSIAAPFGIGKTFFCEGLKAYLADKGIPCIGYNVWEVDFYEDPLTPLICEITESLRQGFETENKAPLLDSLIKKAQIVVSATTLRIPFVSISGKEIVKLADKESQAPNLCNSYKEYKDAVQDFKNCLAQIAEHNNPLVIIIDELDRCRPDYAVKVLETIKHFFDIDGLCFVLSMDEGQLKNSVQQLYGPLNFAEYMRKFVNYSFALPTPDSEKYIAYLSEAYKLEQQLQKFTKIELSLGEDKDCCEIVGTMTSLFSAYNCLFNFSLRAQNQVMQRLILFINSLAPNKSFYPEFAVFLACVREYSKGLYEELKAGNGKNDALNYIRRYIGTDKTFDENKFKKLNENVKIKYYYDYGKFHTYNSCDVFMQAMNQWTDNPNNLELIAREMHLYATENRPQIYFQKMDFIDSFFEAPNQAAAE